MRRTWMPVGDCMLCSTGEPDTKAESAKAELLGGKANAFSAHAGNSKPVLTEFPKDDGLIGPSSSAYGSSRSNVAKNSWQPWAPSFLPFRANSSSGSSSRHSGLWRLMDLGGSHSAIGGGFASHAPSPPSNRPAPPRATPPAADPSPVVTPPSGAAPPPKSGPRPSPQPPASQPPPTDPFHGHQDPLPGPFAGPAPSGPLDPGGSPGSPVAPGAGSPGTGTFAANPEPTSMLLITTGFGILGILRRRRLF
jgi:hypothetical protein